MRRLTAAAVFVLATAVPAFAQSTTVTGSVSALIDRMPNVPAPGAAPGMEAATELRLRAIVDTQIETAPWLRFRFSGVADAIGARRDEATSAATVDALEAWVEASGEFSDVRAGVGRLAWGRLDEIQPTDVVNPIDVSRFLLEGRSEARLAVPFVRGRIFDGGRFVLEAVLVPHFRHGRFDRLDDDTSPFNILADTAPRDAARPGYCDFFGPCADRWSFQREPAEGSLQGGGRASVTTGRVDWSVSAWRGYLPFALVAGVDPAEGTLQLVHPRFTLLGADFETVRGKWAIRGEAAFFPDRPTQADPPLGIFESHALEAGVGIDRRAGDFTLSATVLLRSDGREYRTPAWPAPREPYLVIDERRTNLSVVGGFSRTFNRDRIEMRVFSLVNPADRAAFLRGALVWKPADDVALESAIGWFAGEGDDVITRFGDRDFASLRMKYYFGR